MKNPIPESSPRSMAPCLSSFDRDSNGSVDLEEFKAETKRMMLGMASGLGFLPVQMVLEDDSLLKKAVEREMTKVT